MEKNYEQLLSDAQEIFKELFVLAMVHYEELSDKTKQTMEKFAKTYGR